eukprot:TRINITY_DN18375_c2_g1_i1.p1 TRINITY_DN18375_c2_g1~~TRINITY_DN18375_c2_g1_i1.p1  ORF type:complete len:532 (+),score=184.34 TRINITY_DN18375_c2_g1_i1:122-1597(+)
MAADSDSDVSFDVSDDVDMDTETEPAAGRGCWPPPWWGRAGPTGQQKRKLRERHEVAAKRRREQEQCDRACAAERAARRKRRRERRKELWERVLSEDSKWLRSPDGLRPSDCTLRDEEGNSVLHLAAERGMIDAIAAVVNSGESFRWLVFAEDNAGYTPPQVACRKRHLLAAQLLLRTRDVIRTGKSIPDPDSDDGDTESMNEPLTTEAPQPEIASPKAKTTGGADAQPAPCRTPPPSMSPPPPSASPAPSLEEAPTPGVCAPDSATDWAAPPPRTIPAGIFDPTSPTADGYYFTDGGQDDYGMIPDSMTADEFSRLHARQLLKEQEDREELQQAIEAARRARQEELRSMYRRRREEQQRGAGHGAGAEDAMADAIFQEEGGGAEDEMAERNSKRVQDFKSRPPTVVTLASLPWPQLLPSGRLPLPSLAQESKQERHKHLTRLQLFWHPDKVSQRYSGRMAPGDKDVILGRVKEVAQQINDLKDTDFLCDF